MKNLQIRISKTHDTGYNRYIHNTHTFTNHLVIHKKFIQITNSYSFDQNERLFPTDSLSYSVTRSRQRKRKKETLCDNRVKYVPRQNSSSWTSFIFFSRRGEGGGGKGHLGGSVEEEKNVGRSFGRGKEPNHLFPSTPVILAYSATRANYIAHYANRIRLAFVSQPRLRFSPFLVLRDVVSRTPRLE